MRNGSYHDAVSRTAAIKQRNSSRSLTYLTSFVVVAVLFTFINLYGLRQVENLPRYEYNPSEPGKVLPAERMCDTKPVVWIQGRRIEAGYLGHVIDIFQRLGYLRTNTSDDDWDVLWSHDYPFTKNFITDIKPHQRINHFPGSGFITNKVSLATSDLHHIPKAFHLPNEKDKFLDYAKSNPNKLWVKKSNDHRGIRIEKIESINLQASGTFVQEYINNPYLIDEKKFDIGVYVTLTSINPLRVYIYDKDALLRFCSDPYYPFDPENLNSYVVGDHYTPTWQVPSLKKFFVDMDLNMKDTLNAYYRSVGKNPQIIWDQIEETIRSVYIAKEDMMLKLASSKYETTRHFFEMVRFDFVLDEDLNVYLMEANMSPNLSSLHFAPNKLLYENVIFNLLSLVGLTNTFNYNSWNQKPKEKWNMLSSPKDLNAYDDTCSLAECHLSCQLEKCRVCNYCLSDEFKLVLIDTVIEHNSKWHNKRLIPSTDDSAQQPSGEQNELLRKWVQGKCMNQPSWC